MSHKEIPDILPGSVHAQYVRCGTPNCHCAHGEPHGPYWYHYWRDEDRRLRKEYVRKCDVEAVKAACEATREERREIRRLLTVGEEICRDREGRRKPLENIFEEIHFLVGQISTFRSLLAVAFGVYGTGRRQTPAAIVVARITAADRAAAQGVGVRHDDAKRSAAIMRGDRGPQFRRAKAKLARLLRGRRDTEVAADAEV